MKFIWSSRQGPEVMSCDLSSDLPWEFPLGEFRRQFFRGSPRNLWPENSSLDFTKKCDQRIRTKISKRHLPKTALKPIPSTQFLRTKKALLCKIERQLRLIHLTWVFGNKFFLFRTVKSYKRQTPAPQLFFSAHLGFTISRWQVTGILSDFGPVFWIQPHPWVVKFSQKQPSCFFSIRFLVLRG